MSHPLLTKLSIPTCTTHSFLGPSNVSSPQAPEQKGSQKGVAENLSPEPHRGDT